MKSCLKAELEQEAGAEQESEVEADVEVEIALEDAPNPDPCNSAERVTPLHRSTSTHANHFF